MVLSSMQRGDHHTPLLQVFLLHRIRWERRIVLSAITVTSVMTELPTVITLKICRPLRITSKNWCRRDSGRVHSIRLMILLITVSARMWICMKIKPWCRCVYWWNVMGRDGRSPWLSFHIRVWFDRRTVDREIGRSIGHRFVCRTLS